MEVTEQAPPADPLDALAAQHGATAAAEAHPLDRLAVEHGATPVAKSPQMNFARVNGEDVPVEDNSVGTFIKHAAAQVNPFTAASTVTTAVRHPIETVKQIGAAQGALFDKAKSAYETGDYLTAARHFVDYLLPIVGPALDTSADRMQHGEIAAGAGDAIGLGLSMFGPDALTAARKTGAGAAVGERAGAAADQRVADVMSPKGSSKAIQRTAKQAATIAEPVRHGTTAVTPAGLQRQIGEHLSSAGDALDAAYQAIPTKVGYSTGPLLDRLQAAYDTLKVKGTGGTVIPTTIADRAAAIKNAIKEVRALGPYTNTENLAKLRNNWKEAAKDAFVPELNPNFQQIRLASKGWADAWAAVQDTLTARHPELKPLNADYRIWKQASDVMEALADQQRAKPTVGRTIAARVGGGAVGAAAGGGAGMAVGELVGPMVEQGITKNLAPAAKLIVARHLGNLADAIRNNQPLRIEIVLKQLRPLLVANTTRTAAPALVPATAQQGTGPGR